MNGSLNDQKVLVIGRGSGIARAVAVAARDAGARVIAAGRDQENRPVRLSSTFLTGHTLHIDGGEPLT